MDETHATNVTEDTTIQDMEVSITETEEKTEATEVVETPTEPETESVEATEEVEDIEYEVLEEKSLSTTSSSVEGLSTEDTIEVAEEVKTTLFNTDGRARMIVMELSKPFSPSDLSRLKSLLEKVCGNNFSSKFEYVDRTVSILVQVIGDIDHRIFNNKIHTSCLLLLSSFNTSVKTMKHQILNHTGLVYIYDKR